MNEKLKNDALPMPVVPFLIRWTGINVFGWLFTLWLWAQFGIGQNDPLQNALLVALGPGLIAALGQWRLMRDGLHKPAARAWFPVSLVGQLISAAIYYQVLRNVSLFSPPALMLSMLFIPAALVQALWLRRHVKNAWLWAVAAPVSAVLFALPLGQNGQESSQYLYMALAAILQGIISGVVMLHLWTQERDKDKRALLDESLNENAGRIARLSDAPVDDVQDHAEPESLEKLLR